MDIKPYMLFFFLVVTMGLQAQSPADNWYFGEKAGVKFTNAQVSLLSDGQQQANEGVATLSDKLGNLLFYSDGDTIWNRNHEVMPNGTGLLGSATSTQSVVFCPSPSDSSQYSVFTVDDANGSNGLNYSIIDIDLEGGLGDIISSMKNLAIDSVSVEKLLAVNRCDRDGYWIMCRPKTGDKIHVYALTSGGMDTTPIISNSLITTNSSGHTGYAKSNALNTRIAMCLPYHNVVELHKFNAQTGALFDPILIKIPRADGSELGRP